MGEKPADLWALNDGPSKEPDGWRVAFHNELLQIGQFQIPLPILNLWINQANCLELRQILQLKILHQHVHGTKIVYLWQVLAHQLRKPWKSLQPGNGCSRSLVMVAPCFNFFKTFSTSSGAFPTALFNTKKLSRSSRVSNWRLSIKCLYRIGIDHRGSRQHVRKLLGQSGFRRLAEIGHGCGHHRPPPPMHHHHAPPSTKQTHHHGEEGAPGMLAHMRIFTK